MTSVQFKLIRNKDEKLEGYIIGKTNVEGKPYFIIQRGSNVSVFPINDQTNSMYRVDKVEVKS